MNAFPSTLPESPAHVLTPAPTQPAARRLEAGTPARNRRRALMRRLLLVGDALGLTIAAATAYAAYQAAGGQALGPAGLTAFAFAPLAVVVLLVAEGLYSRDSTQVDHQTPDDLKAIFHAVTLAAFAAGVATTLVGGSHALAVGVLGGWAAAIAAVPVCRAVVRAAARRADAYQQPTVIVGAGEVGQLLARKLLNHPEYGLRLVGFVDSAPRGLDDDVRSLRVLGGSRDLAQIIERESIERVIVAFSVASHDETLAAVHAARAAGAHVDIVPRLYEALGADIGAGSIEGLPTITLRPLEASRATLALKRALDVAIAGTGLLATAPFFALFALLVRLDSKGPVFYGGPRVGRDGRMFAQLKFRTMRPDADAILQKVLEDPELRREFAATQKLKNDPRVTRTGAWLRRTSLDELPQLWNVLRGDLSLVGPRPITRREVDTFYGPEAGGERPVIGYWDLPGFRPGLTGHWQISGRSLTSFDERIRLDTAYLTSWSLKLDLSILAKTLRSLVRSGAY